MDIATSTALVTGANRGLGRAIAAELLRRGARVYAGARDPASVDLPGAVPVELDITSAPAIARAVAAAGDVTLLVNNAGSATGADLLTGDVDAIRLEMETHYFGTLATTRAFAPVLAANGGGAVLNVLSVLSWLSAAPIGAYAAAKAAEWSLTNALRLQLAEQGTAVTALHVGYMDTDMAAAVTAPKADPAAVAKIAIDAVAAGDPEVLFDKLSQDIRTALAGGVRSLYPSFATAPATAAAV